MYNTQFIILSYGIISSVINYQEITLKWKIDYEQIHNSCSLGVFFFITWRKKNGVTRKQVSKISYIFIDFYMNRVSSVVEIM